MPIDVVNDELIPVNKICKMFPARNGKPRNIKTVMRWITHGAGRSDVRLEAERVGGLWYTTADAVREFSRRLTEQAKTASYGPQPVKKSPAKKSQRVSKAMARLRARGVAK